MPAFRGLLGKAKQQVALEFDKSGYL